MGRSKDIFNEVREQEHLITKNTRLGGYDIAIPNGKYGISYIWVAGTFADAKRELKKELKTK